jgi:hypothetical protein
MARGYGSGLVTGVALSLLAAFLAPLWKPTATRYGRPAAKAAIKQGLVALELGRERLAGLGETVEDMLAEAQLEIAAERMQATSPAPPADAA